MRKRAFVYRNRDNQRVAALSGAEAVVLGLMDGTRSGSAIAETLTAAGIDDGDRLVDHVLFRFAPLLKDGYLRRRPYPLEVLARVSPPETAKGPSHFPGPRVLHWQATMYCPRRCAYCYARPKYGGGAPDSTLSRGRIRELLREAKELGAEKLLISGGEPLLRDDLPEVMGDAIESGILPLLATKHPIDDALAGRLADAGVPYISLSLDTMDEAESRQLVGSAGYPAQVRRSVRSLQRAGLSYCLQTVVTRVNRDSLSAVAAFAFDAGAEVLQVVPFNPVETPIGPLSNEQLELPDRSALDQTACGLNRRFPSLRVELVPGEASGTRETSCDVGITKLFFLPNGSVHRCYKLIHDRTLCGADMRQTTLAAAWHDVRFRKELAPPRSAYAYTPCETCDRFERCRRNGRCIFEARLRHGRYAAPDRVCIPASRGREAAIGAANRLRGPSRHHG
jgi:radical SAM protein with 4Fe4S-binding SPASM domain